MVNLRTLRTERGWTLKQMRIELHISIATLSRIEAAEREGKKQPLDEKVARPLVKRINEVFQLSCKMEDLPFMISPEKRGRPKVKVSSQAVD